MAAVGAPRYLLHVATALFVAASGLAPPASALISRWEASSGLLPDEICQPFGLEDTATPEEPVLGATFLTISTDVDAEHMGYFHSGADVSFTDPLVIEARLRVLSGSGVVTFRAPVEILFTLSPEFGNALYLDVDEIFVLSDNNTKGDSAVVDTDGAFHTYRIEVVVGGLNDGDFEVYYDGVLTLTGTSFLSLPANGLEPRVSWGARTSFFHGTSEWEYLEHNAAVVDCLIIPTLSQWGVVGFGLLLLATMFVATRRRLSSAQPQP